MAKNLIPLAPDLRPDQRRSRRIPIVSMVVLIPLAPLLMEAVLLCYAQWGEILGTPVVVRTPILDSIQERIDEARANLWFRSTSFFQRVPWNPKVVLPILVLIMAIAIVILRH